jgi:membrane-bound ClpP family serine protease
MGAAEPVLQDASGEMKPASEKINSAIRADFANRASFFGRNPNIAEAMVDKDLILVDRSGQILKLNEEKQVQPDDVVISPKGKLLTLNAEELMKYGVANFLLQTEKRSEPILQIPLFSKIPNAVIDEYHMDVKTRFLALLAHPLVASFLMLGLMLGAYIEFNHPGLIIPGVLAACCLFLLILSSFSLEIADYLEVIFLVLGLALLVLDFFVLPTFGLIGSLGALLFFAGLFGILLPGIRSMHFEWDTQTFNAAGEAFFNHLGWFLTTLMVGIACILLLARYVMPSFSAFNRLVLKGNEQVGYRAGTSDFPPIGATGVVESVLRPSGKVMIDGNLYDAISTGRLIEKGVEVKVIRIEERQLIVEERR